MEILIAANAAVPHADRGTSIPHRKAIRSWLAPIAKPDTSLAMWLVMLDFMLCGATMVLAMASPNALLQVVGRSPNHWSGADESRKRNAGLP